MTDETDTGPAKPGTLVWWFFGAAVLLLGLGFYLTWQPAPDQGVVDRRNDGRIGESCRLVLDDLANDDRDWKSTDDNRLYYWKPNSYPVYGFLWYKGAVSGRKVTVNDVDVTSHFTSEEMDAIEAAVDVRKVKVRTAAFKQLHEGRKR